MPADTSKLVHAPRERTAVLVDVRRASGMINVLQDMNAEVYHVRFELRR